MKMWRRRYGWVLSRLSVANQAESRPVRVLEGQTESLSTRQLLAWTLSMNGR